MMSSLVLFCAASAIFAAAYFLRGAFLEKRFDVNPLNPTPATMRRDGCDYVPAKNPFILFGHHFSSIAGAGPVIGPVAAAIMFGWGPAAVWILVGTVFLGGTADFSALMVSLRNGGRSITDSAGDLISPQARKFFITFVILALLLVNAVFAVYAAKTLEAAPGIALTVGGLIPISVIFGFLVYRKNVPVLPATAAALAAFALTAVYSGKFPVMLSARTWTLIMLAYAFIAAVLPVNILLQPRDYLSGFLLFAGMAVAAAGTIINPRPLVHPVFLKSRAAEIWPMLFITVACGAISGFHSLISSGTTSKQLAKESHAGPIGYGAMLMEGLLAILAVITVAAGISDGINHKDPIAVFASGFGRVTGPLLGIHGSAFAVLLLNFFILTTLDTSTRITRYLAAELAAGLDKYIVTAGVVIVSAVLAFSGEGEKIWPVFGAANQLVAAMALSIVTIYLARKGRGHFFALWPAAFMFATSLAGLFVKTKDFAASGAWRLAAVAASLGALAIYAAFQICPAYAETRKKNLTETERL